jgi:serine/threonine protein kinase
MLGLGDVIAGKYRVEQMLGRGGMGYVVSALHTQLDQRVAVKFMVPELCEHPEAVARFLREARAAVRIHGEHVARVLDVGTLDDGTPYMVMEFLSGRDLASELEERQQLSVPVAVNYILQACEALAEAHAHGIVHRDLKPANLFLTHRPDGSALIKVLDFGISKAMTDPSALVAESLTASQSLIGSPYYMSPEQVRRPKLVDRRSDIWALGVILYELLSGDRPFGGDTPMSVLAAVVSDPAPALRVRRPETPGELEQVILTCLEKDPTHRFPSVAELAQALALFTPGGDSMVSRIVSIWRSHPSLQPNSLQVSTPHPQAPAQTGRTLPSPMPGSLVASQPSASVPHTNTAFGHSELKNKQRRFPVRGAVVAALLVGFGALMFALGRRGTPGAERNAPQAGKPASASEERPTTTSHAAPSPEPTLPPPEQTVAPLASISASASATPASNSPRTRKVGGASRKAAGKLAPSASASPAATPTPTPATPKPRDPLDERR